MRRKVLCLAFFVGLTVCAVLGDVWVWARRDPPIEKRIEEAHTRLHAIQGRELYIIKMRHPPMDELQQLMRQDLAAQRECEDLERERALEAGAWPARLRREVRRRTGW
jgi:hypothetical protein